MMKNETISVSEFVSKIKSVVSYEPQFQNVAIVGEISNFTAHRSGHFYFSLKDDKSSIRAVMFRSQSSQVKFKPKDGDKVIVICSLDVYEQTGAIQLYVRQMNLDGLGDLHIEFERLKKELYEKGIFDDSHKKALPLYPTSIGIITGKDTAAYADMKRTVEERWPVAKVNYYFSMVQGEYAKDDLIKNLKQADENNHDVIVIARGGGSIEDLWPFNELELIITTYNANTPIVSGVGHESDTSLLDYVSDYRAATPTAAIVAATPSKDDIHETLRNYKNAMYRSTVNHLRNEKTKLANIQNTRTFKNPMTLLDSHYMNLDMFNAKLLHHTNMFHKASSDIDRLVQKYQNSLDRHIYHTRSNLNTLKSTIVKYPELYIAKEQAKLNVLDSFLEKDILDTLQNERYKLNTLLNKFDLLNPFAIMKRGYGIISENDKIIRSIEDVQIGNDIQIALNDGKILTKVQDVKGNNND